MNLTSMRSSFYKHTSSLASELTAAEVDEYLNRAYQYTIPLDVGGEFSEQIWLLDCVEGVDEYPYPAPMLGANRDEPWIETTVQALPFPPVNLLHDTGITYLTVETDPVIFKRKYTRSVMRYDKDQGSLNDSPSAGSPVATGRPTAILFYDKTVKLSRAADDTYRINIPVRSGPIDPLSDSGLAHEVHAQAVVAAASLDLLGEVENVDDPGMTREAGLYKRYRSQLQTYAYVKPVVRSYTRSF